MKRILLINGLLLMAAVGWLVTHASGPAHFGPPFANLAAVEVKDVVGSPERFLNGDIRVQGKIIRQCPSAGCWFYIEDAQGKQLKVELGHMGMKFPQSIGKQALIEGRLLKTASALELVGNNVEFF